LERIGLLERLARLGPYPAYLAAFECVVGVAELLRAMRGEAWPRVEGERFLGRLGRTSERVLTVQDSQGRSFSARVYESIDMDADAYLLGPLLKGKLRRVVAPHDGTEVVLDLPLALHWPSRQAMVLWLSESRGGRLLEEGADFLRALLEDEVDLPAYVLNFDVQVGEAALEAYVTRDAGEAAVGTKPIVRVEEFDVPRQPGVSQVDDLRLGLGEVERLEGRHGRELLPVEPIAAAAAVAVGLGEAAGVGEVSHQQGASTVVWRVDGERLGRWWGSRWRLLVQLHNQETYPLVVLLLAAVDDELAVVDTLSYVFDVADGRHRSFLEQLTRHFVLTVGLFDAGGELKDAARFAGPLAENVVRILSLATARLSREPQLSWRSAVARYLAPAYPRVGTMRHPFSVDAFKHIDSAGGAWLAAGIMGYWLQPPNLRYLLYNQSFSVSVFEEIEGRVIDAALRFGIRLSPQLQRIAQERLGVGAATLLRRLLASCVEVHVNVKVNELDPIDAWENWRLLLDDAEQHQIEVDHRVLELAQDAYRRAQAVGG